MRTTDIGSTSGGTLETGNLTSPRRPRMTRSTLTSGSGSVTGTPSNIALPIMSVGSLLNANVKSGEGGVSQYGLGGKEEERVVNILSLHTQATHSKFRPVPLSPLRYQSPLPAMNTSELDRHRQGGSPRPNLRKRNHGDIDDERGEAGDLGRTPTMWKKWEAAGGVGSEKGSAYCYAFDGNGERQSPLI